MEQARTRKRFDYLECFLVTDRTTFIDVLAKARLCIYDIDIPAFQNIGYIRDFFAVCLVP